MDQDDLDIERMLDELVEREGGFVDHPADRGGATRYRHDRGGGARAWLSRWHAPFAARRGDQHLPPLILAAPALRRRRRARAAHRRRTVRHRGQHGAGGRRELPPAGADRAQPPGQDFADLVPDGRIGPVTLAALDGFLAARGARGGETVLLRALEALQGERYLRLAERRPANEAFLYGWLANRIGTI